MNARIFIMVMGMILSLWGCSHRRDLCPGVGTKAFSAEQKKPSWPGTYTDAFGRTLTIHQAPGHDGNLQFELKQETANCHEGFKGSAVLASSTMGTYKKDALVISLTLRPDQVEISESGFPHHPDCENFSGVYSRSSR